MPALAHRTYPGRRVAPLTSLLIPFALRDGRMLAPHQVKAGLACGCVCPGCGAPVVAKALDSANRRAHFAHHGRQACAGGVESALHRMAKQIIADRRTLLLPAWAGTPDMPSPLQLKNDAGEVVLGESIHFPVRVAELSRVSVEDAGVARDYRPDLRVEDEEGELLVEIRVSHAVDDLKRRRVQSEGRRMLEIDLSAWPRSLPDLEALERAVLFGEGNRTWLSHPAAADAWREAWRRLQALVAAMNRGIAAAAKEQAARRQEDPEARRQRFRRPFEADLAQLAVLAQPDAVRARLAHWATRDAPELAGALAQIACPALRSAVSCPHPSDWAYQCTPALWKAQVVIRWVLPLKAGDVLNQAAVGLWLRAAVGISPPLWRLFHAQYSAMREGGAKGLRRPWAWYFSKAENHAIPDHYSPISALMAQLVDVGALRRVPGRWGFYQRLAS